MPNYTNYYSLIKPKKGENYDVDDTTTTNMDIIDAELYKRVEKQPGKGLSSNDFTNNYKNKIDLLTNVYRYKGSKNTFQDLPTDNNKLGDAWAIINESTTYAWNGHEWEPIGTSINLEDLVQKEEYDEDSRIINDKIDEIEENISDLENNVTPALVPVGGTTGQVLSKNSNEDNDVEWVDLSQLKIISGDTLPVGTLIPYTSANIPANWLLCNGQEVSRTEYELLFNVIGETYGEGDGRTTFNVPNLKGKVPVGLNPNDTDFNNLGKNGGEKEHTLTIEEMPQHRHKTDAQVLASNSGGIDSTTYGSWRGTYQYTTYQGEDKPHNNMQPYIITNYIIKAKQSAGIVANVVDGLNNNSATDALSAKQGKKLNEKIIGTTLYSNTNGTLNNIQLNDSIANYDEIEIIGFAKHGDTMKNGFKMRQPLYESDNMYRASVSVISYIGSVSTYLAQERYEITGTTFSRFKNHEVNTSAATNMTTITDGNYIYITKIIGYKNN